MIWPTSPQVSKSLTGPVNNVLELIVAHKSRSSCSKSTAKRTKAKHKCCYEANMGGGFTLIFNARMALVFQRGRKHGNPPPKSMTGCKKNQGHKIIKKTEERNVRRTPRGRQGEQTLLKATGSAETIHIFVQHVILQRASGRNKIP